MNLRVGLCALAAFVLASCDHGGREVAVKEAEPVSATASTRLGTLLLGSEEIPFTVRTCAIGGSRDRKDFLMVGEGKAGTDPIAINADGSPAGVAVVFRRYAGGRIPAEVFRSQFTLGDIKVDGRTILASGEFRQVSTGEVLQGRLSVSCD